MAWPTDVHSRHALNRKPNKEFKQPYVSLRVRGSSALPGKSAAQRFVSFLQVSPREHFNRNRFSSGTLARTLAGEANDRRSSSKEVTWPESWQLLSLQAQLLSEKPSWWVWRARGSPSSGSWFRQTSAHEGDPDPRQEELHCSEVRFLEVWMMGGWSDFESITVIMIKVDLVNQCKRLKVFGSSTCWQEGGGLGQKIRWDQTGSYQIRSDLLL